MYIFITRYEVRENNIANCGRSFPVAIIRVSKMVKADKGKFKRLYKEDGTYYYTRIQYNRLQKKVDIYWKSCELTGSYNRTEKSKDVSPKCASERYYPR